MSASLRTCSHLEVRTPLTSNTDWHEWLLDNGRKYYQALLAHPNLIPILMRRHPLRIGLSERANVSTVGLLAVQGVPVGAIMPLMDSLESIALGCAAYQSAVIADTNTDDWEETYPFLFHVQRNAGLSYAAEFEALSRAAVDAILGAYQAKESAPA